MFSFSSSNNQQPREKKLEPEYKEKINNSNTSNNNNSNKGKNRIIFQLTYMTEKEILGKAVKWTYFAWLGFIFIRFKQKTYKDCHIFLKQNLKIFKLLK